MHTKIYSATPIGINAHQVDVEVDLSFGLINFYIVGLPDAAIKESRQRIQTALKNSGIRLPEKKITVNLAPADLRKEGTLFDLPIALGIIHAARLVEIASDFLESTLFIGELSLDGSIKPIRGALAIACDALKLGKKRLILPLENAAEAALIEGLEVIGVNHLTQLIAFLRHEIALEPTRNSLENLRTLSTQNLHDFAEVKGQHSAKRALQIAAAGGHNILFIGPPGSGKTMLAQRLPSIMPPLAFEEVIETSKLYSISGKLGSLPLIIERPFRAPHHTISSAGLVGGGSFPQPGEISLAHNGVLFLDELTEFKRTTLEVLRQPLESKSIALSRVHYSVTFPARFLLVAALNPCPCGFWGDKKKACTCAPLQRMRYLEKLSGPLLDRIDLHINIQSIDYHEIKGSEQKTVSSADLLVGIQRARARQEERFNGRMLNNTMSTDNIEQHCELIPEAEAIIKKAFEKLNLSMRSYHKILRIARTIADIENHELIQPQHLQEALMYRSLDRLLDRAAA